MFRGPNPVIRFFRVFRGLNGKPVAGEFDGPHMDSGVLESAGKGVITKNIFEHFRVGLMLLLPFQSALFGLKPGQRLQIEGPVTPDPNESNGWNRHMGFHSLAVPENRVVDSKIYAEIGSIALHNTLDMASGVKGFFKKNRCAFSIVMDEE